MNRKRYRQGLSLLLVFGMALGIVGCGSSSSAANMFLRRTQGTVGVSDAEGGKLEIMGDLGLFSGYGVDTGEKSYAWIDLDRVKLAKLDENSQAVVTKEGRQLSIDVKTGSLFFNVTEPLEDDETMDIRFSTMMVGIRGTCGWVEVPDEQHMRVYLLEGTVECTSGEQTATVNAGEMAEMTVDGSIAVQKFYAADIPDFVRVDVEADEELAEQIREASGLTVKDPLSGYEEIVRLYVKGNKVVFAEEFDFEQDGNPELLVIYPYNYSEEDDLSSWEGIPVAFDFFRKGPDGAEKLGGGSTYLLNNGVDRMSLTECDGRPYLMVYTMSVYEGLQYRYCGSGASQDGEGAYWGDRAYAFHNNDTYIAGKAPEGSESGGIGSYGEETTQEGYEALIAQYPELRVLVDWETLTQ